MSTRPSSVRARRLGAAVALVLAAILAAPALSALPSRGAPGAPGATVAQKARAKKKKKAQQTAGAPAPGTSAKKSKKPPPPPPLDGATLEYDYDGKDVGRPERRWMARAFVHTRAAALSGHGLPLLVFLHGNNAEKIKHRWMGGGAEGDVRRIVAEMIEAGSIPPILVAAPSSIDPYTMGAAGATWPSFDLDLFIDRTIARLGTAALVDRGRVIVAGHSGAGCNIHGGLATAMRPKLTPLLAGFSIDTCMMLDLAQLLGRTGPTTHVVVSWQTMSWDREFGAFSTVFKREVKKAPQNPGVLRELAHEQPTTGSAHDAMVGVTLRKYLPRILGPGQPPAPDADAGAPDAGASDAGP